MDHFKHIYDYQAKEYHRLIEAEDLEGHLLQALFEISPFQGKRCLDIGSGTGRIPLMLSKINPEIICLDLSLAMLLEQCRQRQKVGLVENLVQGDMRFLPFQTGEWDIVTAGWAIGHLVSWFEADWKNQISMVLREFERMLRSSGICIIIETMSTGSTKPAPPSDGLHKYYSWLEDDWGYKRKIIQTDYQFSNIEEAVNITEFFFGEDLANKIRHNGWARVPEWTGVWYKDI